MADDCVFCQIVAGKIPASVVYEDERMLAFMDLHQLNPGHLLVIPKGHIPTLDQLPVNLAGPLLQTVVLLTRAVQLSIKPDGINIWQSNGEAAGQEVLHVHFHIVPRFVDDGLRQIYAVAPPVTPRSELDQLAAQIRAELPGMS